jgi:hypothetical protein
LYASTSHPFVIQHRSLAFLLFLAIAAMAERHSLSREPQAGSLNEQHLAT